MKDLCKTVLFLACGAGAAEHEALHISPFFVVLLIVGAILAFFAVFGD